MRKLFVLSILIIVFSSCSFLTDASVRFQNISSTNFGYGLKLGEAVHEGPLYIGFSTQYYDTSEGDYTVQGKTNTGSWITISGGSFSVKGGNSYTVSISDYGFELIEE